MEARNMIRRGGNRWLWAVVLATVSALGVPAQELQINGQIATWSRTGSVEEGTFEIYLMNPDGTGRSAITANSTEESYPRWSPDGAKIAFATTRDGNSEIYVMNADGTSQVRLTNHSASDFLGAWSPDGGKIAFASDRDGDRDIFVMNADGTGVTQLTNSPRHDEVPDWSPDGTKIAFYSERDGNGEVYVMNSDGTGQTRLTTASAQDGGPVWSPDGARIVFVSSRDGDMELYLMNPDGSGQTRVTTDHSSWEGSPSWSADGTKVIFSKNSSGTATSYDSYEVYLVNPDGTGEVRLTNNSVSDYAPVWAPFRRIGAASTGSTVSRTMVIENTGAAILSVTDITSDNGQFTVSPTSFSVAAGSSQNVTVTFAPTSAGVKYGTLTISSNDLDNGRVSLIVNGTGQAMVVNTTSDADDFSGGMQVADLPGPDGVVSLREAIIAANNTSGPQTISFNIPTNDPGFDGTVFAIRPTTTLPPITDSGTSIDGDTQAGFAGNTNPAGPEIVLDGSQVVSGDGYGLHIDHASDCLINRLVVQNFTRSVMQENIIPAGVIISLDSDNRITNCFIGTDHTGTQARGNVNGILLHSIRGVVEGNLVSGNENIGIEVGGFVGNVIRGNLVGTDVSGTQAIPNRFGLNLNGSGNVIGGKRPGDRNVISGNTWAGIGIAEGGSGNSVIQGNLIGTTLDGEGALGNGAGIVHVADGVHVVVGGTAPGEGNIIAFNINAGLALPGSIHEVPLTGSATVLRNSIHSNGDLGIDLGSYGTTPNDPGDTDTGPSGLMNYPVLSAATWSPSQVFVQGNIDTPNPETVTIEFFANPPGVGSDPSGHGEGAVFLGAVTPDASGTFDATLPPLELGTSISATATDAQGNTSEFSQNVVLAPLAVAQSFPQQLANPDARITVAFNTGLDLTAVNASAVSVNGTASGEVTGTLSYDEQTQSISFFPGTAFQAGETVEVRVSGNLRSAGGLGLDGNGNGAPEGAPVDDYVFSFPVQQSLVMTAYPTSATPVLDGQLGPGEYSDAIPVRVVFGEPATPPGIVPNWIPVPTDEADMSYTAHLVYTSTDLYVAVEVADDRFQDDPDADPAWMDDDVELFIDGDRVANDIALDQANAEGCVILVDIGGSAEGGSVGLEYGTQWYATTSSSTLLRRRIAEFRVPLSSIDTEDGPGITPASSGATIGWNIITGDDDNGGAPYEYPADSYGAWTGSYDNWYHARETDWGRLFFSPIPAAQSEIEALVAAVKKLVDDGALKPGQGNGLIAKLRAAIQQVEKGNSIPAANQLGAFVNQVSGLIKAKQLAAVKGQPLIDKANAIIARLRGGAAKLAVQPAAYFLAPAYPNPFNPSTTINYGLPQGGPVRLTIYNSLGQQVATLVDGWQGAGSYEATWNAEGRSAGVYFYEMRAGEFSQTRRMVLVK